MTTTKEQPMPTSPRTIRKRLARLLRPHRDPVDHRAINDDLAPAYSVKITADALDLLAKHFDRHRLDDLDISNLLAAADYLRDYARHIERQDATS